MILHDAGVGLHFGVDQTLAHLGRHLCGSLVSFSLALFTKFILFWAIWKERKEVFEDTPFSSHRIKILFIRFLVAWAGC